MDTEKLTSKEVAKFLKVHPNTIINMRKNKNGPPYTRRCPGGPCFYDLIDIKVWLASRKEVA